MDRQDLCWMNACEMVSLVKSKRISPVDLVEAHLERIQSINPKLNAYVTLTAEQALNTAREAENAVMKGKATGLLHGVPIAIKDVTYTKGTRTTMGSKLLENFVPDEDAAYVARLQQAGAIILGKTNTPEFAYAAVTENRVFGVTRNPWDLGRTPGGSSGGSAAAVAAGLAPLANGNDVGGSIRIPASWCGIFGIKPQFGRVPCYPLFHLWEDMNHEGPLTRSVKDAALMLDVMSGRHWGDRFSIPPPSVSFVKAIEGSDVKGLRIAWSPKLGYATVSREVQRACEQAASVFSEMGVSVEEATPQFEHPETMSIHIIDAQLGARLSLFGTLGQIRDRLDKDLLTQIVPIQKLSAFDYLKATFARQELAARIGQFFEKYDLLLTPAIGMIAWRIGQSRDEVRVDGKPVSRFGWHCLTPFNLTGQPAASVPIGFSDDGLPIGLQIVGRWYDEITVLRAASAFEQARPWTGRRPPL